MDLDRWDGDRERAWAAHVLVHLENDHYADQPEWLSDELCDFADWVATLRLDRLAHGASEAYER